jgi:hypothetical protein
MLKQYNSRKKRAIMSRLLVISITTMMLELAVLIYFSSLSYAYTSSHEKKTLPKSRDATATHILYTILYRDSEFSWYKHSCPDSDDATYKM